MKRFLRTSALLGLSLIFVGCETLVKQIKKPEVSVKNVEVESMSLADARLGLFLDFKNPNPVSLSMKGLTYQLEVDGKQTLKGNFNQGIKLPAGGQETLRIPLDIRFEQLFSSLKALADQKTLQYRLQGQADFGFLSIPYRHTGSFALPALPKIRVTGLKVNRFSLTSIGASLKVAVDNPNGFPIRLDGFQYALNLAGDKLIKGSTSQPLTVSNKSEAEYSLDIDIGVAGLFSLADRIRKGQDLSMELDGALMVDKAGGGSQALPVDWKGLAKILR